MKFAHLCLFAVSLSLIAGNSQADDLFEPWCDTHNAQGLVMEAANLIYGNITAASAADNEQRKQWVSAAFTQAELRYKKRTGAAFGDIDTFAHSDWIVRCRQATNK
jgi:hypothetical protein